MEWIKAKEQNPHQRLNCFVMIFTPLQGGYLYKSTAVYNSEQWENIREREHVELWLDEEHKGGWTDGDMEKAFETGYGNALSNATRRYGDDIETANPKTWLTKFKSQKGIK